MCKGLFFFFQSHKGRVMDTNNKLFYVLGIVIAFAVSVGIGAFIVSQQDDGKEYSFASSVDRKKATAPQTSEGNQPPNEEIPAIPKQSGQLNALDLSLGVLTIGDPADKVRKALGEPNSTNAKDNGHTFCKYNSMEVVLYQDKVSALVSYSAEAETPRGIHNDSTAQEVFNAYGTDYIESTYEGLILYEYKVTSQDGHPCYLRFAVRGSDQKVDYISARFQ